MDQQRQSILPPLPPSDPKSLEWNKYDYFYQTKSRDFWGNAEVVREEPLPFSKCDHHFVAKKDGAECDKCHFGLTGIFEISNGKLLHKGKPIGV